MTKLAEQVELSALHGLRRDFGAGSVVASFERHAAAYPEASALVCEQVRLTYGQLNRRANAVAWSLKQLGVGRDVIVALAMDRSVDSIVAILGVLKAGGAFLCIDNDQPESRRDELIRASRVRAVLRECPAEERADNPPQVSAAGDLAYVMYTSGSTGQPKGVAVEQGQLWNYVNAIGEFIDLPLGARYATVSTFAADLGHTAVFPALCNGGELHVLLRHRALSGSLLADYIEAERIDLLKIVPSHLEALFQATERPERLIPTRRLVLGGEAASWKLIDRIKAIGRGCVVINHYGPTETTVGVTTIRLNDLTDRSGTTPPIGRPLANVSAYVLGPQLEPVPVSDVGELFVGGAQVARGYLNSDAETAQRFVANPFGEGRLYRTGDLARVLSDGTLQWLGRIDQQVKVRGFRIELGEIEARLGECEGVREAIVLAREDASGEKRLVAYYTVEGGGSSEAAQGQARGVPSSEALREQLAAQLPEYMVPAAFVALQALPLTPNGKVDRKALPAPDAQAYASKEYEAPMGDIEGALAHIWAEVLGVERIGRRDNFFALGGHSLLAVRVASRVQQQLGIDLELGEIFDKPELAALAAALQRAARSELPAIAAVAREQPLALSFAQQRLWFLAQMEGVSQAYHISMGLRLVGALDRSALQRTLDRIVERHEALRTTFNAVDGEPTQHIARPDIGFELCHHDLRGHADAQGELQRLSEQEGSAGFDLQTGPLIRGRLIRLGEVEHMLLLTMHHIVSDGWSRGLLSGELSALYSAFSQGGSDPLPALQIQYPDFAAWQRRWLSGAVLQSQSEYWKRTLAGAPELIELPTDRPRPQRQDHAGGAIEFAFDASLSAGLKALGQRHGATLFMTLLAAWGAVLVRLSGQDEVVIGAPVANRRRTELEPLIGFFVNTLALRLDSTGSPSVGQWLERVKVQALGAQQHQDLPFEQVVEVMRPVRSLAHSPLFQVMFAWEGQQASGPVLSGLQLGQVQLAQSVAKFDLTLTLHERQGGRIAGEMGYASALFDKPSIERHIEYLRCIASAMVANQAQSIHALQILPETERHKLLVQWNDTKVDGSDRRCVHELFEAQAARDPNAVALRQGDRQLSYGELNAKANQLAHRLRALGVKPDDLVAVLVQRSVEMVIALLATLKAGGAYVPLDPAYPAQRLAYMLEDSAPKVILTQGGVWARVQQRLSAQAEDLSNTPVLDLDSQAPRWAAESTGNPLPCEAGLTPLHLAYVIYTSGSTGNPKAAMVTRGGMRNVVGWYVEDLGLGRDDALLLLTSCSFDLTQKNIYGPLVVGAALHLADEPFDPVRIVRQVRRDRISVFNLTPSAFHLLIEADEQGILSGMRRVVLGGEPIQVAQLLKVPLPRPEFVNGYGPTECSGVVACFRLSTDLEQYAKTSVPLGKPIRNLRLYVLDGRRDPVPVGVRGEVYVGGCGVGRGYLNRTELSAERFVPDPFSGESDARMYKTGDLARFLPDGNIEFLGRSDFQVKVRGFRIELGEIEARLGECEGVREAIVLAREDASGEKRLVAYYTVEGGGSSEAAQGQARGVPSSEALREQLAAQLPEYMVPAAFVALQALPLTPNGKVDRKALPAPDAQAYASKEYEAPMGDIEGALAHIWAEVLGVERIGRRDNFFALGGHSLLAVRVASRVQQQLGIDLELGEIFDKPELAALAAALQRAARSELPAIAAVAREQPLALSFAQQRLWFLAQMEGVSQAYHISMGLRLVGALDRSALQRTLDRIVERHEALRTTFNAVDGEPTQHIARPDIGFELCHHDLRGHADAQGELQRLSEQEGSAGFDLQTGPLIRGRLIRLGEVEHMLLLTMHHIVSDGWSRGLLSGELSALYSAFSQGGSDPLPALQIQYPDFAAWQRRWLSGAVLQSQSEYWKRTLAGAPELIELPTDRPRPQRQDHAGGAIEFAFDASLSAGLKALGQRHGATLFMTLLAAWGAVLVRLSGQDEVVIGAPVANRRRTELEPLIGFFVNTLALRLDSTGSPSVGQWLERVKVQALGAQQHQDLPFEQVVEVMRPVRSLAHSPLFQVMFAWEGQQASGPVLSGLQLGQVQLAQSVAKFDLTLTLHERQGGRIAGEMGYASALFDKPSIERHIEYLRCIASAMVANQAQSIHALQILPETERHKLLVQWNDTKVDGSDRRCVHELFEAQAARDPNAVALRQGDRQLSYGELNAKANQLAHRLRALGVKPDDLVAVLVQRSVEMVIALLATLKAGGAYVPLDPAYPAQRLAYMLEDSAPKVILTQGGVWARVQQRLSAQAEDLSNTPVLDLDSQAPRWAAESTGNPLPCEAGLTPLHLAYVIYTSGSTGRPKGVMVEHRQLANLIDWHRRDFRTNHVTCSSGLAGVAFDAAAWELWSALCAGACLQMPTREESEDPLALLTWWKQQPFDISFLPTPLAEVAFADGIVNPSLKTLLIGGDALRARLPVNMDCEIVNNYGPTECAVVATSGRIDFAGGVAHIGRPISNARAYILDGSGNPAPIGARGELFIGGAGVARGYLNRPDLTAESFFPDSFCSEPDARMYKTGDLARYLPDGNIEFLGRSDSQVKIRGFRIELGELEARLKACDGVREAIVLAREDSPGAKRLVAYYTVRSRSNETGQHEHPGLPDADSLRDQLAAQLPAYMVPVAFVAVQALPLTANGKVDRKALPAPDARAFASEEFEAPAGEIETALARIWCEVLGLERIGRRDNFFDLGGHSLKATQVVSRVRRDLGIAQSVRAIFESPSLQGFAARVRLDLNAGAGRLADESPPQRLASRDRPLPTSFSQRRMWLIQKFNPATTAYNISLALELSGVLDESAMLRALEVVSARHEAFRTRFVNVGGEPMQRIVPRPTLDVARFDLRDCAPSERRATASRIVGDIVAKPFDLSVAGLHRIALLRLDTHGHVLLWLMHHAIGDQWSFGILLRELRQAYDALTQGRSVVLPQAELDYADYAAWQRERAGADTASQQLQYWRGRLEGVVPLPLPTDFARQGAHQGEGGAVHARLEPAMIARLRQLSLGMGVTPYMIMLAGFQMLMARISGRTDIAAAAPIANRLGVFSEGLVGTFVNTLVMRCDLSGNPSFVELLAQVQETALQAYANQDVPFEQLMEGLEIERDVLRAPLVQVLFNLVNAPFDVQHFADLKVEYFAFERRAAQFEIAISVDLDVFRQVQLSYASTLFARATAQRLLESFVSLIESVLEDPNRRIDEYQILGDAQRQELASWNRTHVPRPVHRSVAELISSGAARCASRPALRDLRETLSHAQLDAKSNRLAHELRRRGIARGALVGLCVERSNAMVVAQLAVLKSGAAYVPLDPVYPPERLSMMAEDAQFALLVTQSAHASALNWSRANSLWLDEDGANIEAHPDTPLAPDASLDAGPDDRAYVIYTSGSTGKPKGVAVPHGAVLNFLASMAREPGMSADDRVLAVTTLSFDIAVLELLLPLSVGATIILASTEQAQDGRVLRACLEEHQATVMQATPSTWRMLLEAGWQGTPRFKALIGGEALPLDLAQQLLARTGELWNMYGPTETTVWSTLWRVVKPEAGICIGRPIANTQVHVLDEAGRLCPIGVPGEICIGGDGVALGYLHRPELTAERFVADPFRATPGARMYRTGDLGRWRYDGQLEHQGRLDHQVKIRGHRIELGEIEANLGSFAGVARVVVISREDLPGDTRIVAYVVPRGAMPAASELREHVRAVLPQYMLPQHFVQIESVPLLPNGKLDRSKLPKPSEAKEVVKSAPDALDTDLERGIAQIWQHLLNIESVGRSDNFFDLGGHSLLAMRAVSEIEKSLGVNLSPRRLIFETLAQLAAVPDEAMTPQPADVRPAPALKGWLTGLKRLFGAKAPY